MLEEAFSTQCQDYSSGKMEKCTFWYTSQCKGIIHSKFGGLSASSYVCLAVLLLYKKLMTWPYLNGRETPLLLISQIWERLLETQDSAYMCRGLSTSNWSEAANLGAFKRAGASNWRPRAGASYWVDRVANISNWRGL